MPILRSTRSELTDFFMVELGELVLSSLFLKFSLRCCSSSFYYSKIRFYFSFSNSFFSCCWIILLTFDFVLSVGILFWMVDTMLLSFIWSCLSLSGGLLLFRALKFFKSGELDAPSVVGCSPWAFAFVGVYLTLP